MGRSRNFKSGTALILIVIGMLSITIPVVRSTIHYGFWRIFTDIAIVNRNVNSGGVQINYTTYGAGPALVLLHGGLSSGWDWFGEIPRLAQKYKLIVVDSRGSGGSELGTRQLSYRLLATDVAAVLADSGIDRAHIAGWSDGGNVGLLFALDYPERINRLIAISANFSPDGIAPEALDTFKRLPGDNGSLLRNWTHSIRSPEPDNWPEVRKRVYEMWSSYPQLTRFDLGNIKAPTLVIVGSDDDIERSHSTTMAESIPSSELVVVPDVGHAVPRAAPAILVNEILRFLSESDE